MNCSIYTRVLATVLAGLPHVVVAQEGVIMRRPLPVSVRPSLPTSVAPKPPVLEAQPLPADPVDPRYPVSDDYYYWDIGAWRSSGSCGSPDAALVRDVACLGAYRGEPGSPDEWSYSYRRADPSNCTGAVAVSSMKGQGAGCDVVFRAGEWSAWTPQCSPESSRTRTVSCTMDGRDVSMEYCRLNLSDGGQPYPTDVSTKEEGPAFEGCAVKWTYAYEGNPSSNMCSGSPPSYSYTYVPRCMVDAPWIESPVRAEAVARPGESNEAVCVRMGQGASPRNDPGQALSCNFFDISGGRRCTGEVIATRSYPYGSSLYPSVNDVCSGVRAGCMTVMNDPRDADPSDTTPGSGRSYTLTCHRGTGMEPAPAVPAHQAGAAAFTAYAQNPPAYRYRDVPDAELRR